ncbi:MAG TPA: chorismate-binding protein, partial [Microbacterium sp.]|nr:chorismate-binding protein [Microbacterium sp.]
MTLSRLAELSSDPAASFVLIARDGADTVELLSGDVVDVDLLADIPLSIDGTPREVFALVPYRQVRERGFVAQDDGAPLRCIVVDEHLHLPTTALLDALPADAVPLSDAGFDIADEEYAAIVERVIADEIGRGEGANFVIRRDFTANIDVDDRTAALTWFRALLTHERGAYWTFAVFTPGHIAVGASPEAHVVAREGVVTMNPISGTFRHPAGGATKETLVEFLSSTKETEELFMVVDEELKMMSAVCSDGGRITGPHLKEMSRLTHTEYMLRGRSRLDPRDILRETMFAPTVTGSPMQNACAVIRRHERKPRGYYSGVAALFTPNAEGGHDLDAPILIRTVYLQDGALSVPVGATLVRHSDPFGEVSETHGKAAGVLGAIGAVDRDRDAETRSDADAPTAPR